MFFSIYKSYQVVQSFLFWDNMMHLKNLSTNSGSCFQTRTQNRKKNLRKMIFFIMDQF
jgi:hypothetical protein